MYIVCKYYQKNEHHKRMNIANKEVMITCRRCGNIEPNLRYFDLHVHVCISLLLFCSHTHCIYMYM